MPTLLALEPVWAFLKKHWHGAVFVALVLVAFVTGRCSRKAQITTVTQVQWKERVVTQTVEKKAEAKTETKTVVLYRDRIVHKDGSSETKTEVRTVEGDQEQTTDDTTTAKTDSTQGSQKVTITPEAPRWYVGADFGVPVALKAPFAGTPFVVGHVDYRLFGPFSVGAWGSVDIKGQNPALGLSVGVSF